MYMNHRYITIGGVTKFNLITITGKTYNWHNLRLRNSIWWQEQRRPTLIGRWLQTVKAESDNRLQFPHRIHYVYVALSQGIKLRVCCHDFTCSVRSLCESSRSSCNVVLATTRITGHNVTAFETQLQFKCSTHTVQTSLLRQTKQKSTHNSIVTSAKSILSYKSVWWRKSSYYTTPISFWLLLRKPFILHMAFE